MSNHENTNTTPESGESETLTIDGDDATETVRKVPLRELAWCDSHREEMRFHGCDDVFATLDLVERANEADVWGEVALEPADAEFRVGLDSGDDEPHVHISHTSDENGVEIRPLCCALDAADRETTYAMAQDTRDDAPAPSAD